MKMDYKYTIDNIDFFAKRENIDEKKEVIKLLSAAREGEMNLMLIIVDSKELEKEIIELYKSLPQNYVIYDIYDAFKEGYVSKGTEIYLAFEKYNDMVKNQSICIINCSKLRSFVDSKLKDEIPLYYNFFNYCRDGLYRLNKSQVSIVIPDDDYMEFLKDAIDFVEYSANIDFNDCFKANIQDMNCTLANYLTWKSHNNLTIDDESFKESIKKFSLYDN